METALTNVAVAAVASITAALESQRRDSLALKSVATSECDQPVTSCFHSHFRSQLLEGVSFDNTLFVNKHDGADGGNKGDDLTQNQIHPHMWVNRNDDGPPVECKLTHNNCRIINSEFRCTPINEEFLTRVYGSRYGRSLIQNEATSIIFNGTRLARGKSYCLPIKDIISQDRALGGHCDHIAGEIEISYNKRQHRFVSQCICKWPDLFGGQMCNEYIGCKIDSTLLGDVIPAENQVFHGSLINRDTADEISNINDLHDVWMRRNGNIDLYAISQQLTHTRGPAWYCACKKINKYLTGGIIGGSCIADPCIPLSHYMHLGSQEALKTNPVVDPKLTIGTPDSRDTKLARWNCHCGDPNITQLYGGGDTPCAPLVNVSDFENYEVNKMIGANGDTIHTIRNVKCTDKKKIFMPCKNRYRPYFLHNDRSSELPKCSDMGLPGIVNPDDLPEAGACINVCKYCNAVFQLLGANGPDSDLCSTDNRTIGFCETDETKNNANPLDAKHNFKCSCGKVLKAQLWNVSNPLDGPCIGSQPPCKAIGTPCSIELHNSPQGPECCDYCYSLNPKIFTPKCVNELSLISMSSPSSLWIGLLTVLASHYGILCQCITLMKMYRLQYGLGSLLNATYWENMQSYKKVHCSFFIRKRKGSDMNHLQDIGECSSSSSTVGSHNLQINNEYEDVNFDENCLENIIEGGTSMECNTQHNDFHMHDNLGTKTKSMSITDVWNQMCTIEPAKYGGKYSTLESYLTAEDSDCSSIDWNESVDSDEEEVFHNPPDVAIFKHDEKATGPTVSLHNDLYECAFESYNGKETANSYIDKITKKLASSQSINRKFHKRGEYLNFSTPKRLYKSPTGISQGYTFDVSSRRFVSHSFQHLCTAQSNADPLSAMPRNDSDPGYKIRQNMLTIMHQLFPNTDIFEYAMDILMSLLVSGNHSRMIVVCWGKRRNGKSLFLNIVSKMFEGKRLIIHVPKRLLYKRGESEKDSTTKECLGEDRLAVINELLWGAVSQSGYSMLKSMVGSDVNANRGPYGMDNNNATFNAVPMIVSNDKPSYLPCEGALSDRIRVLPFFSTFLEGNEYLDYVSEPKRKLGCKKYVFEADPTLLDKNKVAEVANALMLYICARTRYLRFNLNEMKSIRFSAVPKESWALKNKLEEDADPLFRFCRRLSKGAKLNVRVHTLATAFEQFLMSNYNKAQLEPVTACYPMAEIIQILSDDTVTFSDAQFDTLAEDFLFINRLQLVCRRMNFNFNSAHTSIIGCAIKG